MQTLKKKNFADSITKYRIGSISKSLTSVGLGLLFERKTIEPNSIVENYVPYANSKLSKLTIKELASHTSGIRNYSSCLCFPIWEFYNNNQYNSIKQSVLIFNNDDLIFEPSTDFNYSTYNYTLLSGIIEGATNLDYLEFMKTNVFEPLN
ncbi:serine hydrolase domain-containing protein [Autumnicola psychrophila]|uniref:Serine hydrolase domain-containing protein n=1 Tax=Autumnicola psychrophila TaxID=3075592 RepID=A0ABU3DQ76_9FLAO|nr:serine hydrolase domain-containing protein [Zunongwangia sp. F225]MDT0685862.1 serine hydrolase domain-containing protein [Zunongwangia sp. F225]